MTANLEVSFNSPQCGWMSIGFEGDGREFHTTTAHAPHELALSELLRILTALLDDDSSNGDHLLQWNRDPEAFDFKFVRRSQEVTIEIYQYPTDAREPGSSVLEFSYTGNVRGVCEAFAETFGQLYDDRETDEFEFNWRQPFPYREYEQFEKALKG